jgi:antitoxin component YwqK of YwqJK toxin-antitoxin module
MINKYSCIFLFLLIASSVFTQNRISVDQTNIDFNDLPEIIVEKENEKPYTGIVFALYNNGNIQYEWSYLDGIPNGKWKYYFYTGKVQYEFTYLDGEKHGPCRAWHFNGKLNFESQYKNNELHGEQVFWTYNGELDHKRSYANGKCIAGCMP